MCAKDFLVFHFLLCLVFFAVVSLELQATHLRTHLNALVERGLRGYVCMLGWFSLNA